MKKIFLVALVVLLGAFAAGAQDVADTVAVNRKSIEAGVDTVACGNVKKDAVKDEETVRRNDRLLDFDIPFYSKVKKRYHTPYFWLNTPNVGFGFLKSYPSEPYDFSVQNSYEIFANIELNSRNVTRRSSFAFGLGVSWKNFSMTGRESIVKDDSGNISVKPYPENADPRVSRLRLVSVTMPLTYSCALGRGWGFTLGPVLNFNAYGSIVNKYTLDGEKQKDKYKKIHCNAFTVDLMYQLNIDRVTLFVKYCPMPLMDKSYWPDFQYGSAGVALAL